MKTVSFVGDTTAKGHPVPAHREIGSLLQGGLSALPRFIQVFCSDPRGLYWWVYAMLRPPHKKPPHRVAGQAALWGLRTAPLTNMCTLRAEVLPGSALSRDGLASRLSTSSQLPWLPERAVVASV